MIPKYPGKLITFEGCDGSGKTTQIKLLEDFLKAKGYDFVSSREPGGDKFSESLRYILLSSKEELSLKSELMGFLAARANYVEHLLAPALIAGKTFISDRFIDSTFAYQGFGNRHNLGLIAIANRFVTNGLKPDITLFIDIDPRLGLQKSTRKNRYELRDLEYMERVRLGYLTAQRLDPQRIRTIPYIDGDPQRMHELIVGHVTDVLANTPDYRFYLAVKLHGKSEDDHTNDTARRIATVLRGYGRLVSEHFLKDEFQHHESVEEKLGVNILDRDMAWLEQSDAFFLDLAFVPSYGMGRELQRAADLGMPRICFHNAEIFKNPRDITRSIMHDKDLRLVPYNDGDLEAVVRSEAKGLLAA